MEDNEDHPNADQNDMPHQTDGIAVLNERGENGTRKGSSPPYCKSFIFIQKLIDRFYFSWN